MIKVIAGRILDELTVARRKGNIWFITEFRGRDYPLGPPLGRGARGCDEATGCEVACKHWSKCMFSGCEVGVMYGVLAREVEEKAKG